MSDKLLAFDTSTEHLSVAVRHGDRVLAHSGVGGAQASSTLLPLIRELLADAGLALAELDAIVFGRGPGSFTGLRTACSVAQGLAFGAKVPLLPVDTLLAVADEARHAFGAQRVVAVLDARMDQLYAAHYDFASAGPFGGDPEPLLLAPEALEVPAGWAL
uniref:tRNA (adenosine(37)-N6)-threonylcarbamoyltransferase complex dimerization subunit type 1 TsaB n=2 Tax=Variovorax TaxID=34072 RepID=UPI0007823042